MGPEWVASEIERERVPSEGGRWLHSHAWAWHPHSGLAGEAGSYPGEVGLIRQTAHTEFRLAATVWLQAVCSTRARDRECLRKSLVCRWKRWSRRADLNRGPADYELHKYLIYNGNLWN